jgi:HD-GYP domain-containing protein (c-di-GMP phosphodiesterase class II)
MTESNATPHTLGNEHFTRAVTEMSEHRAVVAKEAIFNAQGVKIIEKGTAINARLYDRLTAHKLPRPIEDALTAEDIVDGRALRKDMELLLAREPFYARMAEDPTERNRRLDVIEKLPLPEPMAFQVTLARDVRPGIYQHSLRAMWTMVWLAHQPLGSRFELAEAAAVGLLHDIGMLHLDPELLDSKAQLSREQQRQLYSHPIISAMLLERHHVYPKEVVRAVFEHHECLNASGYPRNLSATDISPLGRCMSLTEVVTAMISDEHTGGELRLSVLMRMNMHRYDPALITRVMGLLRPDLDPASESVDALDDPVGRLTEVDDIAGTWPGLPELGAMSRERGAGLAVVTQQMGQLRRSLAEAGLTPTQLEHLGDSALDPLLSRELSLLAREAAWQLRALSRETQRRWKASAQEAMPVLLQAWIDRCELLASELLIDAEQVLDD